MTRVGSQRHRKTNKTITDRAATDSGYETYGSVKVVCSTNMFFMLRIKANYFGWPHLFEVCLNLVFIHWRKTSGKGCPLRDPGAAQGVKYYTRLPARGR